MNTKFSAPQDRLAGIRAQAIDLLAAEKSELLARLAEIEKDIAHFGGTQEKNVASKAVKKGKKRGPKAKTAKAALSLEDLISTLKAAPKNTLGIRGTGYDTASVKKLIEANPGKLKLIPNGPQPNVALK